MPCPCLPCLQSLEHEIANFGKERDNRVKAAQAKIAAAKKAVEGAKQALKAKQAAMQPCAHVGTHAGRCTRNEARTHTCAHAGTQLCR